MLLIRIYTFCPTCWIVHTVSLESICQNHPTLFATWEKAEDATKQPDVKVKKICDGREEIFSLFDAAEKLFKHFHTHVAQSSHHITCC